jgi:hypothetical protein
MWREGNRGAWRIWIRPLARQRRKSVRARACATPGHTAVRHRRRYQGVLSDYMARKIQVRKEGSKTGQRTKKEGGSEGAKERNEDGWGSCNRRSGIEEGSCSQEAAVICTPSRWIPSARPCGRCRAARAALFRISSRNIAGSVAAWIAASRGCARSYSRAWVVRWHRFQRS